MEKSKHSPEKVTAARPESFLRALGRTAISIIDSFVGLFSTKPNKK